MIKTVNKKKNRKKLANLLLKNYILLYLIMTLILFLAIMTTTILGGVLYFNLQNTNIADNPYSIMQDDYTKIDTTEVEKLKGYIEIVDTNNNVIYRKGTINNPVDKYTIEQYNLLIDNTNAYDLSYPNYDESKYIFRTAYNKNSKFLLVIAIPKESIGELPVSNRKLNPKYFIALSVFCCVFVLLLGFVIYSRISSKNFVKPLKILIEGARKISEGDYSARIDLRAKNEFGELRDAFNIMAEKIEEERDLKEKSEEMRRRLILDISHDLKNPLANIIGYSDFLIKNHDITKEEQIKYLDIIQNNSSRANGLLTDLFEFSKLQSIDFKLIRKMQDICEFLRTLIAIHIPQMEEKGIDYNFDIPDESLYVEFDEKHLDRALSNLILNSVKYNPSGTRLYIKAFKKDYLIYIIIEDNGIGIPKQLQNDIFDPFVRVDVARNSKSGGTGLGLAITKSIIEKHGGKIYLESDTDKGAKFTITL